MVKLKFCGIRTLEDIECVNILRPDYIGFIFAESKRQIDIETAYILKKSLSQDIKSVGVFVDTPIQQIENLANSNCIDIIQLHGDQSDDYIYNLKQCTNKPIIKAVSVKRDIYISTSADYILFDSFDPVQKGGTGKIFDWSVIKNFKQMPYFIAGGMNIDTIPMALKQLSPYCIDISSGIETDGKKDFEKMKAIINLVRGTFH